MNWDIRLENKNIQNLIKNNFNDNQCNKFIKSFSCLLAGCLGINIKNIKLKDYIQDWAGKFKEFDVIIKIFEKKKYYENNIKKLKDTIKPHIKDNIIKYQFHLNMCKRYPRYKWYQLYMLFFKFKS